MLDRTIPPPVQNTLFSLRRPTEYILPGGIPLYIVEAPGTGALRLDVVFPAGKQSEARNLQSYYAVQMLREGCQGYTAAEFAERVDYYGTGLRATVQMSRTCVSLVTLKKHFAPTIELMHRMLTAPAYDEDRLRTRCEADKAQMLVNLKKGGFIAMRALRQSIYGEHHPCGLLVEVEDYDTLTSQSLREYYDRCYSQGPCKLFLSGDVDDSVVGHVVSTFGSRQSAANGQRITQGVQLTIDNSQLTVGSVLNENEIRVGDFFNSHSKNPAPQSIALTLPDAVQDTIRMGCPMMEVSHPDYGHMRVLTTVLGGYFGSRLMQNVREEKGYTYDIGAHLVTTIPQVLFCVYCEAQAGKAREVIGEVYKEMLRLQTELISDDELLMVRNYMLGDLCRNYETAFDLIDAYLFEDHLGLPPTHFDQMFAAVQTASPERLRQLAQQYLRPEMMHVVVVSNGENENYCVKI